MYDGQMDAGAEWDKATRLALERADLLIERLGRSKQLRVYVSKLKIYSRVPYICAAWVPHQSERIEIGSALCMHAMGLKLLDDLVDGDQPLSPTDLASAYPICEYASEIFRKASGGFPIVDECLFEWSLMWRYVMAEPGNSTRSLSEWEAGARRKSLLALYVGTVCNALKTPGLRHRIGRAMESVAVIGQIVDDFKDFETLGERNSNIASMIKEGMVDRDEARVFFKGMTAEIAETLLLYPPHFNFIPFVEGLVGRAQTCLQVE